MSLGPYTAPNERQSHLFSAHQIYPTSFATRNAHSPFIMLSHTPSCAYYTAITHYDKRKVELGKEKVELNIDSRGQRGK